MTRPDDKTPTPTPTPVTRESTDRLSSCMARAVAPGSVYDRLSAAGPATTGGEAPAAPGQPHGQHDSEITPLPAPPHAMGLSPADFLDEVALRLARRVPGAAPRGKTLLGLGKADWGRLVIGWTVAIALGVGAWWLQVRDGLRDRPTSSTVQEGLKDALESHSSGVHPKTQQDIDVLRAQAQEIREAQIRQEQIDISQTETLHEIRDDVKTLRRRSR